MSDLQIKFFTRVKLLRKVAQRSAENRRENPLRTLARPLRTFALQPLDIFIAG